MGFRQRGREGDKPQPVSSSAGPSASGNDAGNVERAETNANMRVRARS